MKLGGHSGSRSQRAVWALKEAEVDYEYIWGDVIKGEDTQDINRFVRSHMPATEPITCHRASKCEGNRSCDKRLELWVS